MLNKNHECQNVDNYAEIYVDLCAPCEVFKVYFYTNIIFKLFILREFFFEASLWMQQIFLFSLTT